MPLVVRAALVVYLAASVVTLVAYGVDKRRARRGARRVPERTLHLLELAGGWPGALVGMQLFAHKRRKARYWLVTAAIALLHVSAIAAWLRYG